MKLIFVKRAKVFVLSCFLMTGCIKSSFQPIPPLYMLWVKSGASHLDVKMALMECGWPSPNPSGYGQDTADMSPNDRALTNLCMEKSGFATKDPFNGYKLIPTCEQPYQVKYPACQPNAIIPTRSVERRLNSAYCKGYGKNTSECLPPGQEYVPQEHTQPQQKNSGDTYEPIREYPEKSIQLQQDMQNQSNHDMERMLRNTAPKTHR